MFFTYLAYAAIGAVAAVATAAVAVTVISIYMTVYTLLTIYNLARTLLQRDTNGATKARVEDISTAMNGAKIVKVGLFKGDTKVGNNTIECENGTNLHYGETVYF